MQLNLLERAMVAVNPQAALRHLAAKEACRSFYDAGDQGRTKDGWTNVNATGHVTDRRDRDIVRARARDLERNDDGFKSIILDLERNVVGTGIVMQAKVSGSNGDDDDKLNNQIEDAWKTWCGHESCTVTGMLSLWEVEKLLVRRIHVDGAMLVLPVFVEGQFTLQLLEVDCLDSNIIQQGQNRVVGGIEINAYNRPIAYHIRIPDIMGMQLSKVQRVPAEQVIYLPRLTRSSQVREMSPTASALSRTDDVKELIDAALTKERIQACFGIAVESQTAGMGSVGRPIAGIRRDAGNGGSVYAETSIEPGMILELRPGEKVSSISPSGISSTADGIVRLVQRQVGSGAGLSYEAATRDMSQVNYSSARQGMLQDRKTYSDWQEYLIEHFLTPVYRAWMDWAVLTGRLVLPGYHKIPDKYHRVKWMPAGWEWIDPLKEANGNRVALETGQTTLQNICAGRGEDWRDILKQQAEEQKMRQALLGQATVAQEQPQPVARAEPAAEPVAEQEKEKKPKQQEEPAATLNGAQITSLVSLVMQAAAGALPFESAVTIIMAGFGFDEATTKKILNNGKLEPPPEVPQQDGKEVDNNAEDGKADAAVPPTDSDDGASAGGEEEQV